MSQALTSVSDDEFDTIISASKTPVLVDFWAEWCAPCKAMMPTLEEVAENYAGELTVVKLDIVQNERTAARFGVRAIPFFLLFEGGCEKARLLGPLSKTRLVTFIDDNLRRA